MTLPITPPTRPTSRRTKMLTYSAALLASLGILTATSSAHSGTDTSVLFSAPTPVSCELIVSEHSFGQTFEGIASSEETRTKIHKCDLFN